MKLLFLFFTLLGTTAFANWNDINSNINDDLTGIVVWDTNAVVSGSLGLYYSHDASAGSATWTRFDITGNNPDSIIYNNTQFTHCFGGLTNVVYACGEDTVNNKAVIMELNISTLSYSIIYVGGSNTRLNQLGAGFGNVYAVGNDGLLIEIIGGAATPIASGLTGYDLSSFSASGTTYWYGANGSKIRGTGSPTLLNYTVESVPYNLKDVECINGSLAYMVGDGYWHWSGNFTEYSYYNYGPLNGNEIFHYGNSDYVGTDHGIFYSNNSFAQNTLEWQPSSQTHAIQSFCDDPLSITLYACGDAGVILTTQNGGGESVPYTDLLLIGGCVNTSLSFSGITGSSTNCQWYIDGVSESSNCNGFSHTFSSTGSYEIKLVGDNGVYADSSVQTIYVVNPPQINLLSTVLDSTICHTEPFDVSIDGSENNVQYQIKSFNNPLTQYNLPVIGNGGTVNLTTIPVNDPGPYYILAESTLANCALDFTNTLLLTVENTTANAHVGMINAATGEDFIYYENCTDANNYEWNFGLGASVSSSNLPNPTINYSTTGVSTTQLICWSNNACYDSVEVNSPMIYAPPAVEDLCWTNFTTGENANYSVGQPDLNESKSGALIACNFDNKTYVSQHGVDLFLPNPGAGIIKYGKDGAVKWYVRTHYTGSSWDNARFQFAKEDTLGNIYVMGRVDNHYFVDNSGDTLNIANSTCLLKLDSVGVLQWSRIFPGDYVFPEQLNLDHDGNVLITADIVTLSVQSSLNNGPMETWFQFPYGTDGALFKIAPDGNLIWELGIDDYYSTEIGFDIDNNVYVIGTYTYGMRIYSVSDPIGQIVGPPGSQGIHDKMVLIKFSEQGELNWFHRSISDSPDTEAHEAVTDKKGNTYITGQNGASWGQDLQVFYNTDGSTTTLDHGSYFIAKIDSSGICNWVNGADFSSFARGLEVALSPSETEIITCGSLSSNNPLLLEDVLFTSQGPNEAYLDMGKSDVFIARYDSAGVLLKLCQTGDNQPFALVHAYASGLFYGGQDTYYLGRCTSGYPTNTPYSFFGDTIIPNQLLKESVTRFSEDCATCICPGNDLFTVDTICENDSYTFMDGVTHNSITASMDYIGMYPLGTGCNGQLFTSLIVQPLNTSQNQIVCYGDDFTFSDGSTTTNITSSFVHTSVLTTPQGCPLNKTVNVNVPVFDLSLQLISDSISSLVFSANWQWLDCGNNYAVIPGETNQGFVPSQNGLYAAQFEKYGCIDTTECILIDFLNIDDLASDFLSIYPTPTLNKLTVFVSIEEPIELVIVDARGKLVGTYSDIRNGDELDLSHVQSGVYYIHGTINNHNYFSKIVKL